MILTRNPNTTCPGEDTVFTCTTNSHSIRWLAEPYIDPSTGAVYNSVFTSNNRLSRGPNDAITTVRESRNPLITSMTISGNLIDVFNVTCQALDSNFILMRERSELYQLASTYNNYHIRACRDNQRVREHSL